VPCLESNEPGVADVARETAAAESESGADSLRNIEAEMLDVITEYKRLHKKRFIFRIGMLVYITATPFNGCRSRYRL
jgi:hypothetical protein